MKLYVIALFRYVETIFNPNLVDFLFIRHPSPLIFLPTMIVRLSFDKLLTSLLPNNSAKNKLAFDCQKTMSTMICSVVSSLVARGKSRRRIVGGFRCLSYLFVSVSSSSRMARSLTPTMPRVAGSVSTIHSTSPFAFVETRASYRSTFGHSRGVGVALFSSASTVPPPSEQTPEEAVMTDHCRQIYEAAIQAVRHHLGYALCW